MPINNLTEDVYGMLVGSSGGGAAPFEFGNALQSDGVNDYVSFPDISFTTGTVSFWFKTEESTGAFLISSSTSGQAYIMVRADLNQISIRIGGVFRTFNFTEMNQSEWYHCMVSCGVTETNVYLNGVASSDNPTTLSGTTNFDYFFRLWSTSNYYEASLDEVAIWNGVVGTQQNAIDLYNSGNGDLASSVIASPTAYWRCNEADGATTLVDETGNYNGTLNNFSTQPAYFVPH